MFDRQTNDQLFQKEQPWKPIIEIAPNCPRCASSNTKFCYYNNYSLSQPRYFCKACRRYWTKGGSLRNVPVGGGCRKNRRSKLAKPRSPLTSSAAHSRDSNEQIAEISNCGSDIDMAAVFANFLSQKTAVAEPDGVCEKVSQPDLFEGFVPCQEEKREEAIMGNEIGEFGLQSLVGDDALWSEETASFSWQPMAHLQDVEAFVPSPVNDNIWSSFDYLAFSL